MAAQKELVNLLLSLFSADELRRWLRYLPDGESLGSALPGPNASPMALASAAVEQLVKEGMIGEDLWARMIAERPRRRGDIDKVRALFAGGGAEAMPAMVESKKKGTAKEVTPEKVTVLLVSASPDSEKRLRVDREFRDVIAKMRESRHRDRFKFEHIAAARFDDLRTALLEHQPQVLHISSHGDKTEGLVFEGKGTATQQVVSGRQLKSLLAAIEGLRLVVLNACESHAIARTLPEVTQLAIGMTDKVADQAAIDFAVAFYETLGFGRPVETAFKIAIAGLSEFDVDSPQLFPPASEDAAGLRKAPIIRV